MAFVILISVVIPVFLWTVANWPVSALFGDLYSFFLALGQVSGLIGICLFSINLMLSTRLRIIENFFNGLNIVYKKHHMIGKYAFLLMIVHPIFMLISRLTISISYGLDLITPGKDFFVDLGMIALFSISTLLVLTLFAKIPYHLWRLSHKFTGVVFVIAVFHSFLIPSTISHDRLLWSYMLIVSLIGIVSYLYRTILFKLFVKRYQYKVSQTKKLTDKVIEIRLTPKDEAKKISYYPGQFVFISFKSKIVGEEIHPFSISSANSSSIEIISKNEGDYTSKLMDIEIDSEALVEGAYGRFSQHYFPNPKQIWIAGGIGITPFIGMSKEIDTKSNINIDLYCCLKDESEKLGIPMKNVNLHMFYSKTMGHITGEFIKEHSKEFEASEFFICGPNNFMKTLRAQLVQLGIKNSHIHSEEFSYV